MQVSLVKMVAIMALAGYGALSRGCVYGLCGMGFQLACFGCEVKQMDKYIKFETVMSLLRRYKDEHKKYGKDDTYYDLLVIMDALKREETVPVTALEQAPKWIPVSERLPKESGVYYVTEKVYAVMDERRQSKYKLVTDHATYDTNKKQWLRAKFLEVVAWMERTPWEGEQHETD